MAKWAINKPGEITYWTIRTNAGVNLAFGHTETTQVTHSDNGDKFQTYKGTDYSKFCDELDAAGKTDARKEVGYFRDQQEEDNYNPL